MIDFNLKKNEKPYKDFIEIYSNAKKLSQLNIEAACLSTVSSNGNPRSRFINVKYINDDEIIFFSNYESHKSNEIKFNSNVALNFFWSSINAQIRIEGTISKLSIERSNRHWKKRSDSKNALALSSKQSSISNSYQKVKDNYEFVLKNKSLLERPEYWGGYLIKPLYFEFWTGHKSRVNKRKIFKIKDSIWQEYFLQP